MMGQVVGTVTDREGWLMDDLDHHLVKLILYDRVVLCEKLRCLSKSLEETHQSSSNRVHDGLEVAGGIPSRVD